MAIGEAAREGPRTVEAYETAIEAASGDIDTILRVFASLLRIAQVEAYGPVAEDAGQGPQADVEPGPRTLGDRHLLTQLLANLVESATRLQTRHSSPCWISLRRDRPRRPRVQSVFNRLEIACEVQ